MRQPPEFLGESEGVLVYIAKKLKVALALEKLLTDSSVDYVVEADEYFGGVVFHTTRTGAFFYVLPDSAVETRNVLLRNGYRPYEPTG